MKREFKNKPKKRKKLPEVFPDPAKPVVRRKRTVDKLREEIQESIEIASEELAKNEEEMRGLRWSSR